MEAELTIEIARSPEEVFGFLTDVANVGTWQSGVQRAEIVGGGEARAGARISESRTMLGRELHTTLEIVDYEPPRLFTLRALDAPVAFTVTHELEPAGEGTRLHVVAEGDPGLIPGFAAALVARRAKKQFEKDFAKLKSQLED